MQEPLLPCHTHGGLILSSAPCEERSSWCLLQSIPALLLPALASTAWPGMAVGIDWGVERMAGRGEPGLGKAQPPALTFHCGCHFLLGREVLDILIFCFNDLRPAPCPAVLTAQVQAQGGFQLSPCTWGLQAASSQAVVFPVPLSLGPNPRVPWESLPRTCPR